MNSVKEEAIKSMSLVSLETVLLTQRQMGTGQICHNKKNKVKCKNMVQLFWVILMGRKPRELSKTGLYHIIFRGLNRQNIFEEEADFNMMKSILCQTKEQNAFNIYAYCFMSNYGQLFIEENQAEDISYIMHREKEQLESPEVSFQESCDKKEMTL